MKNIYLILAIIGGVIPYLFFFQFFQIEGLNFILLTDHPSLGAGGAGPLPAIQSRIGPPVGNPSISTMNHKKNPIEEMRFLCEIDLPASARTEYACLAFLPPLAGHSANSFCSTFSLNP